MRLEDVRSVVTGAAGGMGRKFVSELLHSGAKVVAADVDAAGLRRLAKQLTELRGELHVARVDVTDESAVVPFVSTAVEYLGSVNVLINAAGIARDGLLVGRDEGELKKLPTSQWRKVIDVNLTGQFLMTREVVARMLEAAIEDAVIVNVSSLARAGNPGQANYAASKAGLDACTRTWALELARHGIRVAGIAPGVVDTEFLDGLAPDAVTRLRHEIPLGRLGTVSDLWHAVRFVLECEFFTGRTVEVDGGAVMGRL